MADRHRLDHLRRTAEASAGTMREVAQHLEAIAELLPTRDESRRLLLRQNADRLVSAADLLIAEVNAGDAQTAGLVARVGATALLATGALLGSLAGGIAEGSSAAMVQRAMEAQERAVRCIGDTETAAALASELAQVVRADIEQIRRGVLALAIEMSSATNGESERIIADSGARQPDLGVPNARQRLVYLGSAIDGLGKLAMSAARDEVRAVERLDELAELVRRTRRDVEILAVHDESLHPPQPIRD